MKAGSRASIGLLNGPNLANLGKRGQHYGSFSLGDAVRTARQEAAAQGYDLCDFQSDEEAELIRFLQGEGAGLEALVINAGALSHAGYALYDALLDFAKPVVEIHISDISLREPFRRSLIRPACQAQIMGWGLDSYRLGVKQAAELLQGLRKPAVSGRTDDEYARDPQERLSILRGRLSEIDQSILDLLLWRQSLMPAVHAVKTELDMPILDTVREEAKKDNWKRQVEAADWPYYRDILEQIMALAKEQQSKLNNPEETAADRK